MTRADIILSVSKDSQYLEYCRYTCRGADVYKDLYQYVMLYLCELPEDKLLKINEGNLRAYIRRVVYINANYKNTPFYKEYTGGLDCIDGEIDLKTVDTSESERDLTEWKDGLTDTINNVLEEESKKSEGYAWKVELFKLWAEIGTYRQTSLRLKIPRATVRLRVLELIDKINENFNHNP